MTARFPSKFDVFSTGSGGGDDRTPFINGNDSGISWFNKEFRAHLWAPTDTEKPCRLPQMIRRRDGSAIVASSLWSLGMSLEFQLPQISCVHNEQILNIQAHVGLDEISRREFAAAYFVMER